MPATSDHENNFVSCCRLGEGRQQVGGWGVVAKGFADVDETVLISGAEDEAAAELERIFAELVLAMPGALRAPAAYEIVPAEQVEGRSVLEPDGLVGLALVVYQERKIDLSLFMEHPGVVGIAQADGDQTSAFLAKVLLVLAQLRDMLAAEDSAPMAEECDDCRAVSPQRSQADRLAVDVR